MDRDVWPVLVMGRKEPLPTMTLEDAAEGKREESIPASEVMCAVAPVSMYHAGEDGWASDMVLKDCISWP